jgi:4-hydroxy-tetrahydrodipicolinate synthase
MTENLGKLLGRIIIPMVTPFKRENGDIDYPATGNLIEHLITNNYCDSLLIEGTTGEFSTFRFDERVEFLGFAKQAVAGRRPMVAGTGAASTKEAVLLTQEAEKLGYDVAMIVAPYFCRPTQEGLYDHYKTIAQNTIIPIMLYNIPLFTGVNISPETVGRLAAECKNIVGIKDEAGINPTQMTEYARMTSDHFTIYNGDDIMVLCGLAQGAAGVISGGSHVIGDKMRNMIELFLTGKVKEAEQIHKALDPFFKSLGPIGGVNPIPGLKTAIEFAGVSVGPPRLPLVESTKEEKERVREQLIRLGLIEPQKAHSSHR